MESLKHGFVIVTSGKMTGRIGRYTGNKMSDNQKAMIYFGYEGEELKYANYEELPHTGVSNDFKRVDLLNRFYSLRRDLKIIDLRGHPTIRNHSASHRSLISEYNLIRMLINESLDLKHLEKNRTEKNIYLAYAPNDALFAYDLVSDLDDYKYTVCGDSHELPPIGNGFFENVAELCGTVLFVLSKHTDRNRLKTDYLFFKKYAKENETPLKIVLLVTEPKLLLPDFSVTTIDLYTNYGKGLNELLYLLSS
ncbi:MAG: hypothetical protein LBT20_07370 [Clostridiales bacterium]|jgi:hypothetical protein|nr:hypothetical protein [Clostridiales bacterium]